MMLLGLLVTIGVLVLIHEYGHYRVAVAFGVKVDRFSIGFGKVLWRRQPTPGGTEFVISAVPLGGYVRWVDEREGGVLPHERSQMFASKPLSQRTAIVAAGPLSNLILAVLLFAVVNWVGVDEPQAVFGTPPAGTLAEAAGIRAGDAPKAVSRDGADWHELRSGSDLSWELAQAVTRAEPLQLRVAGLGSRAERTVTIPIDTLGSREVEAATMRRIGLFQPYLEALIGKVTPDSAAATAGLQPGDRVLSVDGKPIADRARLIELIRAAGAGAEPVPMTWRVERAGQAVELAVTPATVTEGGQRFGRIGADVGAGALPTVRVQYGFGEGLSHAVTRTWEMSVLTLKLMGRMLIGQASLKNLSGPLTIGDYAAQSAKLGLTYFLGFLAIVSVSLGVLNLLPLPVLDGGHLMYYLFEAVTGRPVSELWLARLQRGGLAFVLLMMSLALYNDVARLLGLH